MVMGLDITGEEFGIKKLTKKKMFETNKKV
jgi:hypothetical protein